MAELSQIKQRNIQQQEQIGRRASIVPDRRDTRQPQLETNANMRQARRGSGSADQLLRALGMAQEATDSFQQYAENKHTVDEQANIAQGAADQAAGTVDDAMMERSLGYRNAVTQGRTVTRFAEAQRQLEDDVTSIVEQQDQVSLEERQAQVDDVIESFYQDFARDPDTGELRDFLQSPGAMRYLAGAIQQSRPAFKAEAMSRIEARFNEEALSHYSTNIADQARETGTVDFAAARALLPDTVSDTEVADTTIVSVNNAVEALEADGRYEEAGQLLINLRGYVDRPADAGTEAASGTGTAPTNTGRIAFDDLAAAVMHHETRGNPDAVSPVGAVGTMQTMPETLRDPGYGVTPAADNSPAELERVGRDYLRAMLREYNGDYVLALAAYNAGPGRVNQWIEEGRFDVRGQQAKIDAIPFEETRAYAGNVLATASGGAPAAPRGNPEFRLNRPQADPITLLEQNATPQPLGGLDGMQFTAVQQARINQMYDRSMERMRAAWTQKRNDDQAHNASTLALGLLGQGPMVTPADIAEASQSGAISPEQVISLTRMYRTEQDRIRAEADRQENRRDRAEARRQQQDEEAMLGTLLAPLLTGDSSPGEVRDEAIRTVAAAEDPLVAASALRTVLGVASAYESGIMNSDPVRERTRRIDIDLRDQWQQAISGDARVIGRRQTAALAEVDDQIDAALSYYSRLLTDGKTEEEAWSATTERYLPRLQAITTQFSVPQSAPPS